MDETKNPTLRELLGKPVALPIGDATIDVQPMGWYQAADAIEQLMPAMDDMPLVLAGGKPLIGDQQEWLAFALKHRAPLLAFSSIASGLPEATVRALPPAAMVELVLGLVEINADFFVRSLPTLAKRVADRLIGMQASLQAAAKATAEQTKAYTTPSSG